MCNKSLYLKYTIVIYVFAIFQHFTFAQNTVGLIESDQSLLYDGYTLLYPNFQSNIYLINNCGQVVHEWINNEDYIPYGSAYLLENGNIVYTKYEQIPFTNFFNTFDPNTRYIDMKDWEGNMIYSYQSKDDNILFHHDFYPMENGNLLIIAYEKLTFEEAILFGRDSTLIPHDTLWSDLIIEVNPFEDTIVWKWHAKDHLIQNLDSTKNNYGELHENPGLININNLSFSERLDIMHLNSIDYNPTLDQILVSSPYYNEIWIIDHSTTSNEASEHTGGNSNKGGDLIYRWGNSKNYSSKEVTTQFLFFQHNARWINKDSNAQNSSFCDISIFNNRVENSYSAGLIIRPEFDFGSWEYKVDDNIFLPNDIKFQITHPIEENIYSRTISSFQVLSDENYLILDGDDGTIYELTSDQSIIFKYIIPFNQGMPLTQGDQVENIKNNTFSIKKYPAEYGAFDNKNLSSIGYLELEPNESFCSLISVNSSNPIDDDIILFPNPARDFIYLNKSISEVNQIQIINLYSQQINFSIIENRISLEGFFPGFYVVTIVSENGKNYSQNFLVH